MCPFHAFVILNDNKAIWCDTNSRNGAFVVHKDFGAKRLNAKGEYLVKFGEYAEAMRGTGLFIGGKGKFAAALFDAAGSEQKPVNHVTAKSWVSGHRICKIYEHFPDDKVDEKGFIKFLSDRAHTSWPKLQEAFRPMADNENCVVNLKTKIPDEFYWSLLNQFQKIYKLPLSTKPSAKTIPVTASVALQTTASIFSDDTNVNKELLSETLSEQSSNNVRDRFIKIISNLSIMDIINKKPPILYRIDSTKFNVDRIDLIQISPDPNHKDAELYTNIQSFTNRLSIQALSIEAVLNNRFGFDDESASINMEIAEDTSKSNRCKITNLHRRKIPKSNRREITKQCRTKIPELSLEVIADAQDPLHLVKIAVEEWGNFRDEMNFLYKEICTLP